MKHCHVISILLAAVAFSLSASTPINWRVPDYTLTARALDVRTALETFAVAEGVPMLISDGVKGVFSGNFDKVPAREFLDRLATIHNLTWYYDGATIWVYSVGESSTALIDLRYMKGCEVLSLMRELGVEDARFPLKEASEGELIMVSGPPRYVALVVEMIGKADRLREQRTFMEMETRIFPVFHTWADNVSISHGSEDGESSVSIRGVASLLQEIMAGVNDTVRTKEGTNDVESASAQAAVQPIIRAENRLNAVVVRDVATRMPQYERLIRELDQPQKLVEIAVTKLELAQGDVLEWEASLKVGFEDVRNVAFLGQEAGSLLSEASLAGLTGGYSYLGDHVRVSASVYALKQKGKTRTITRSSLLTLNNLAAEMSETQSYNTRLEGERAVSVTETSAGTRLSVRPRVVEPSKDATNALRQVWLTMTVQDGGFDYDELVDGMPTKATTLVETQAALPEGHSLLIAGNYRDVDTDSAWGIPYLRDIPWIGWIFGGVTKVKTTVQRMFILTPYVVDIDSGAMKTQEVMTVQMLRQRDITNEMELQDAAARDDRFRHYREAEVKERGDIHTESMREQYQREEKERELRKRRREVMRARDHRAWEKDVEARREAWEAEEEQLRKQERELELKREEKSAK